ncbi:MAG: sigma-70 family RNA polymerase sigma factor [Clostridia bacterium]|nr:sigma-70 family RNA polymerase sigma factor [Clostridia bacterium]
MQITEERRWVLTAEIDYTYIGSLVDRTLAGDSDAFAELYAATCQKQYLFSCCYLKDENLAQDALQETYILALKNLGGLQDGKLFISWLNQINFRVCYRLQNRQQRYNNEMRAFEGVSETAPAPVHDSPEAHAIRLDDREYILQQVMALPPSESQVIFLHYYKEMKINDIAYLMDLSRSTVKRYLASGKARLSKSLSR